MAESKTEKESFFFERIFGDDHHKTTISGNGKKVVGRGITPEQSQENASEKWEAKKEDD